MRKTLLMGVALIASSAAMGQMSNQNMVSRAGDNSELVLDSIVTKKRDGNPEKSLVYGYDSQKRMAYEMSITYSQWSNPAYKPAYGDSISYEYNQEGTMIKASTYRYNSTSAIFELNSYIEYEYNDKGLLAKESLFRYNQNVETYIDNSLTEYEYAEDGSLVKRTASARPSGAPWETDIKPMKVSAKIEYSDFAKVGLPKKTENYTYTSGIDGAEGTWELSNYYVSTYDDNFFLIMKEVFKLSSQTKEWEVSTRNTYICNERGQVTYEEYSAKNSSTALMEVSSKKTYTYDTNGNLLTITGETYQASKSEWVADSSHSYYYSPYSPTSVRNIGAQNVEVYYNVTGKEVCVQAEESIGGICIYSASGLEVMRVPAMNTSRHAVDVSGLEKGLYIVTLITDGEIYNKKIYIYE